VSKPTSKWKVRVRYNDEYLLSESEVAARIAELERELAEARKLAAAQADEPGPPTLAEAVEAMFKCIEASPYAVKSAELESVRAALARERGR